MLPDRASGAGGENVPIRINYRVTDGFRRIGLSRDRVMDVRYSFRHVPLRLGYACTFTRSQGMTMEMLRVSGRGLRKSTGIVYVGLSRCRSLESTYLDELDLSKAVASYAAIAKFPEHFAREVRHLQSKHPEWFEEYYANIDDVMGVQKMHKIIHTEKAEMPSKNTRRTYTASSRGSSQGDLRAWLLKEQKSCPFTGEDLPSLLEAAHIKSYSEFKETGWEKAHEGNAMLMKCDLHTLFDEGYFSLEADGTVLQSRSFAAHPFYAQYRKISLPDWVKAEYLKWHREEIFDPEA
jgi:hypothetical protein